MAAPAKPHLRLWYALCCRVLADVPYSLTMRQWAIFMHVYLAEGEHTVRSLARAFHLPKASICRALDSLSLLKLVRRRPDPADKRSILVLKTMKGIRTLNLLDDLVEEVRSQSALATPQEMAG